MGQNNTYEYEDQRNWSVEQIKPNMTVLKNRLNKDLVELHHRTTVDQDQFLRQNQLWKKRMRMSPRVAGVLDVKRDQGASQLCSKSVSTKVITEHMKLRLDSIDNLNQNQSVSVLSESLKGFEEIKKNFNTTFPVDRRLIGYNANNQIKTWLNQDLSQNKPSQDYSRSIDGQHKMCQSIINAVQQSTKYGKFPEEFNTYLSNIPKPYKLSELQNRTSEFNNLRYLKSADEFRPPLESVRPLQSGLESGVKKQKQLVLNLYNGPGSKI